eukprot:7074792-Prymnesium_polylepis.2
MIKLRELSATECCERRPEEAPRGALVAHGSARGALFEGQNGMLGVIHGPKLLFAMALSSVR